MSDLQDSHCATPLIVVQARLGSTRYPGKVLLDLAGEPLIARLIERIRRIETPAKILVATTTESQDDRLAKVCRAAGIEVFRGHPTDLLDRHYQAALEYGAKIVAKVPSDCPLIDPAIIDQVFERFTEAACDYASDLHPASYPDGNDVEVMRFEALKMAWQEASLPLEREHTTPFIWERPERFRLANVVWEPGPDGTLPRDYSMSHRWTIDYPEDYVFIRRVYQELYPLNPAFGLYDILDLLERKPDIHALNARYAGVNWYRHHLGELKTITARETRII
ncbi:MAG TPA: glycosyltransferase family protein [Gammaproteobacteria bacterium]|nr:glycosyltransferase family protein [Gammaproteobacteria bacterium]